MALDAATSYLVISIYAVCRDSSDFVMEIGFKSYTCAGCNERGAVGDGIF